MIHSSKRVEATIVSGTSSIWAQDHVFCTFYLKFPNLQIANSLETRFQREFDESRVLNLATLNKSLT